MYRGLQEARRRIVTGELDAKTAWRLNTALRNQEPWLERVILWGDRAAARIERVVEQLARQALRSTSIEDGSHMVQRYGQKRFTEEEQINVQSIVEWLLKRKNPDGWPPGDYQVRIATVPRAYGCLPRESRQDA